EAGGCDAERQGGGAAEDRGGGVHGGDVAQDRWMELDVLERLAGAGEGELTLCGAVGVVERGLRGAALGDPAQVVDRVCRSQPPLPAVELGLLELQQRRKVAGLRDSALDHPRSS